MTQIVEEETKVVGENPNKHYTFIIHNLTRGTGGLEHLNSTTLEVNRWTYSARKQSKKIFESCYPRIFPFMECKKNPPDCARAF